MNPLAVGLTPDQVLAGISTTELERIDVDDVSDAELGVLIAGRLTDDDPVVAEAGVIVVTDASWRLATPFYVERSLVDKFVESHADGYGEPLAETDVVVVDFVGRRLVVVYHDDGPMFCYKAAPQSRSDGDDVVSAG